ncbi:MAG: energy-coupling factor ABC transporter permease [Muribaculaceae bacterium]|nr:energy-coupling factor ABC transporter permease [Muribaculaceae bacterium]
MHMSDALVSPAVAAGAGIAAATLIAVAASKVKKIGRDDIIPLMGVMGAFVFAAQMINFSIPGTGSSGHVIGGILLSAVLGPWAAFITLCSVLIIQCLVFADGGLLALGCNILNMGVTSCLIAYPLIYRPIAGSSLKPWRITLASIAASVVALEIGAAGVTLETELSGITALPTSTFLAFMLPIHLAIGAIEGIATAAVLCFLAKYRPETLYGEYVASESSGGGRVVSGSGSLRHVLIFFGIATLIFAGAFTWIASSNPDGLEWSIEKVSGISEMPSATPPTAFMPGYDSRFAGIVGALIVMVMLWAITTIIFHRIRSAHSPHSED